MVKITSIHALKLEYTVPTDLSPSCPAPFHVTHGN